MSVFRILVADDHPVFRLGVCSLLGSREGWEVCGEAVDGRDAVEKCRLLKPDLVVLDICMPKLNGVDAIRQIMKDNPAQRILVLTDVEADQVVQECLEAGVRGWVFKSDATNDLTTAVEELQRHKCIFSSRVSELIVEGYLQRRTAKASRLSPREREVVQFLGEGKTTKEVAMILNLAPGTVETHRSNIMLKLNIHSIAELVLYAVKNGFVYLPTVVLPSPHLGNGQSDAA
jgi:DNA-binding NarL/FixJ family response regulator